LLSTDFILWLYLKIRPRKTRIILYHGVSDEVEERKSSGIISKRVFEQHLAYLRKYYRNVPLSQLISSRKNNTLLPPKGITITFDDGHENNYRDVLPLLLKYGFTSTFLVTPQYIEMAQKGEKAVFWWDLIDYLLTAKNYLEFMNIFESNGLKLRTFNNLEELKENMKEVLKTASLEVYQKIIEDIKIKFVNEISNTNFPRIMNWQQLKELKDKGMEIGAHTMSHVAASSLPSTHFRMEFGEAKEILEKKLGVNIEAFAFPYGQRKHYNQEAIEALKKAGYRCALLVLNLKDSPEKDSFCLNRIPIDKDDNFRMFKLKASGLYDDLMALYRLIKFFGSSPN